MATVDVNEPRTSNNEVRSVPDLFRKLRDETSTLLREEVALAKAEMSEKASRVGRNVAFLTAGGMVAYAGFLFLLLALSRLILVGLERLDLTPAVALWIAPAIVGVLFAAIGYGLLQAGINRLKRETMAPKKTVPSLQENKEWIKEKIK
jgi:hypothetical protein